MARRRILSLALTAAVVLALAAPARADDATQRLIASLAKASDPEARRAAIPGLVRDGTPPAAGALARLVRRDPDLGVRAAAAEGLGRIASPEALDHLIEIARAGGTHGVREAVGRALAARKDAAVVVAAKVPDRKTPEVDRVLLLGTLAHFGDGATRAALVAAGRGAPSSARDAAWRALGRRTDAGEEIRLEMIRFLAAARDEASAMAALDAFEPAAHPDLRPMVERHATSLEPSVHAAAEHFLARIRVVETAMAARPAMGPGPAPGPAPDDRYAPPAGDGREEAPPAPPDAPPLARYDIVYVLDVTGSTSTTLPGLKERMFAEVKLLADLGSSLRIGVVAYRDGPRGGDVPDLEVLPLTYDRAQFTTFVEGLKARGVDSCGAAVAQGLRESLDRMPWRWDAVRQVQLFADTACDDPRPTEEMIGLHFRGDRTRTRIAYMLRTRGVVPPSFADLARAGGTGVPELVK